ncbi:hypothetical protein PYW08_004182 [Mythimna loreyi]|uniref:Uncharacterized protein n=1 Tax=Mythimna loreyi TaxID=667449 RepID=A0ACC2QQP8_9NEOP|nr:hypothetical protein PYW08_004182 [Mythimna loreyi]
MVKDEKLQEYEYSKVSTHQNVAEKQEVPTHYGYGVRHIQLLILFLCLTVNFIGRSHMGVTVVSMTRSVKHDVVVDLNLTGNMNNTNTENVDDKNMTTAVEIYSNFTGNNNTTENYYKTFDWPKSTQEMVLSSFFVGYGIMTIPMGLVVQRWGGKIPMQIALSVNGVVSILTPWLVNWGGWKAVCACRIAQGLSQAGIFPSLQALCAKWVPVSERGALTSYVFTGSTSGTILAFQLSGYLSESRWGWPSTFWAVGLMFLGLFAILTIFVAASPSDHKTISEEEKIFIMGQVDNGNTKKHLKIPWRAMLCSRPVWGMLATQVGSGISNVLFYTQVPSYIHYITGVNVRSSGYLSSLPYVFSIFTSILFGWLSDFLTNRNIITIKTARIIFNSISQVGLAAAFICVTFTSSTAVAVACLIFSMGCHMGVHVGFMVNQIDLAPNFGGTLMMVGNMMTTVAIVLQPVLVSFVVTDVYNKAQWRIIFLSVAGMAILTNFIFIFLMSADLQPWNDSYQKDKGVEETGSKNVKEKEADQ